MKKKKMTMLLLISMFLAILSFAPALKAASFQGLGDLPGGISSSCAYSISADGSVVVGWSYSSSGREAFRWEGGVMTGLGDLPGGDFYSIAHKISDDGSVIVGRSVSASGTEACWWKDGLIISLGELPGGNYYSEAFSVSADGSVIVGETDTYLGKEAFHWSEEDGMIALGDLPGWTFTSRAFDVSSDGSVVVGYTACYNERPFYQAFRWTQEDGMIGLGSLLGVGWYSEAGGISAPGTVIVGCSDSPLGYQAFRWTQEDGMIGLGDLPGGTYRSAAFDVSADGSVIVGHASTEYSLQEAFIWDAQNGIRNLREVLINDYGLDLTGWLLRITRSVSHDGLTIVGEGVNPNGEPEGWIARLHKEVAVDIKPGSYPNTISLGTQGLIPVAIFTELDSDGQIVFDATTVDPETVEISGMEVAIKGKGVDLMAYEQDVDKDGFDDLVVHVATANFDLEAVQEGRVLLTGKTYSELPIEGWDYVTIVPVAE